MFVKKYLHTQKLLTILIAQLNLDELRTASTSTCKKSSKQIDNSMSVPGGTISVFKHLKQFIHPLVCFYSNLFSSFLMLLHSWVDFFQSSICSRYHFFATLLVDMSLLAKAIYKFSLACSSIFCATSRFYWAFACFCCMWCSFFPGNISWREIQYKPDPCITRTGVQSARCTFEKI